MDDENSWKLASRFRGTHEVPAHFAVAFWRIVLDMLGNDSFIVRAHHLRFEEFRAQLLEQHRGSDTADRKLRGLVEKSSPVDPAVDIGIEQNEQFLIEIMRGFSFHFAVQASDVRCDRHYSGFA